MSMRVAICIASCQRPRWLAASLQSLSQLLLHEGSTELKVIIVDNDPNGSAREPVAAARPEFPWPLSYDIEPQRGISFARNRAVRLALAWEADWIAFLDDDETASPQWLRELLAIQQRYAADVVSGSVVPSYEPGVAEWVVNGRFFERPRHASGTLLECAITANCLISARLLADSAEPFHPAFALGGGGDTHFFRQAHAKGASIVWADAAIVYERIPASRTTVRWLLQRAYRGGTSFALTERLLHRTPMWMLLRTCTGTLRGLQGLALLFPSLFLGKARVVGALRTACVGAGLVAGTLGLSYREYKVIHGE
jgi:succinoglycan biosynthesis protein ExoM